MNTIGMIKPTGYVSDIKPSDSALGAGAQTSSNFSNIMKSALDQVNESQHQADVMMKEFQAGGDVELHNVMAAMQTSTLSFQTLNVARNKVVQAYQSIMNMSI